MLIPHPVGQDGKQHFCLSYIHYIRAEKSCKKNVLSLEVIICGCMHWCFLISSIQVPRGSMYCKLPLISPGLIQLREGFWVGL